MNNLLLLFLLSCPKIIRGQTPSTPSTSITPTIGKIEELAYILGPIKVIKLKKS
jgi:hypothetical protein